MAMIRRLIGLAGRWRVVVLATGLAVPLVSALLVGEARPASPGSRLIAFTRSDAGLCLMRADGGGVRQLRPEGAAGGASALTWSPDGHKLAFATSLDPADPDRGIWVVNADGSSDPVRLIRARVGSLSWSADGRKIAFTWYQDIWVVNADGSSRRRLTNTPSRSEIWVDWSPAGDRIAFSTYDWGPSVYVIDTSGPNVRKLAQGHWPDWSPDGRRIAFTSLSTPEGNMEISVMGADGRSQVRLTHTRAIESNPVWSPDGRKIAFVRKLDKDTSSEIYVMNADGTGVTRLTHSDMGEEGSPAWQPLAPA